MTRLLSRALVSGVLAGAATTFAAALAGRRTTGSYAAPLNATSHFLWGERAARQNRPSLKFTATGVATNFAASVFWALFYEGLAARRPRTPARALADAALVAAAAYVTDYHLVPKRLTPGWEMRVPPRALSAVYGALALGLCARDLLRRPKPPRYAVAPQRELMRQDERALMRQAEADVERGLEDTSGGQASVSNARRTSVRTSGTL